VGGPNGDVLIGMIVSLFWNYRIYQQAYLKDAIWKK